MIYKIRIDEKPFYGIGRYIQKLDHPPIPKKVIKALQLREIIMPLTQILIYDRYDLVANFQYGCFLSATIADTDVNINLNKNKNINSDTSILKSLTLNYSCSEQDLLEITNNGHIEFYTMRIALLLLTEKVNNQQLCLYRYLNDETEIDALAILINDTMLICTEIILYPKDDENKSRDVNNIIIHNRNDYPIRPRKKVDINFSISEKELIDNFFIMRDVIESKKLIKKLQV